MIQVYHGGLQKSMYRLHKFWDAVGAKIYANFLLTNPGLVWYNISALLRHPAPATTPTKMGRATEFLTLCGSLGGKEDFQIISVLTPIMGFEPIPFGPLPNILPLNYTGYPVYFTIGVRSQ